MRLKKHFIIVFIFFFLCGLKPAAAIFFEPEVFTLDNGMSFYVIRHNKGKTLFHGIFYRVGSLDDPLGKEGLAHFFEHMMFKGKDENLVYNLGGSENAYTTYHMTVYHQSFPKEQLRSILRREVRRMEKLPINDAEFRSEKQVILEERLQSYDNRPASLFREHANGLYYYRHPYGRPVIGTRDSILNINREDMDPFFDQYYTPQNAFSIVVGNIDPNEAFKIANATLGQVVLKKGEKNVRPTRPDHKYADIDLSVNDKSTHYPSLTILANGPSITPETVKSTAALSLLLDYLTDGENAYLNEHLAKKKELTLSLSAYYNAILPFDGMVSFSFTPEKNISSEKVFDTFNDLLKKLVKEGIKKEKLDIHKKRLNASQIYLKDSPDTMLHAFGSYLSANLSVEEIEDIPNVYKGVTTEDVKAALYWLIGSPKLKGERRPS